MISRSLLRTPRAAFAAGAVLALGVGVTGCTSDSSSSSTATVTASATPGSGDVVALAEAFESTLSDDQKESLEQDYSFDNAQNWSNLPNALLTGAGGGGGTMGSGGPSGAAGGSGAPSGALGGSGAPSGLPSGAAGGSGAPSGDPGASAGAGGGGMSSNTTGRVGLQTDSLSDNQWKALDNLLAAATGSGDNEGYDEIQQHLDADDYLNEKGGGDDYGRDNFFIAFLGTPSTSGTWELQFGGHHLAVANTYKSGKLAGATPSFRGIEPFTTVTVDGTEVKPEQQEASAFSALLKSLSTEELATAKNSSSFNDIVLGPGDDWAFPTTSEGIKGSELSAAQKKLLLAAINTYVDDVDDADAKTILATYEDQLDNTYVTYAGTTGMSTIGDYIRIDGPRVWIEFSQQNGVVLQGAHPHAVWRDKSTDYAGLKS